MRMTRVVGALAVLYVFNSILHFLLEDMTGYSYVACAIWAASKLHNVSFYILCKQDVYS